MSRRSTRPLWQLPNAHRLRYNDLDAESADTPWRRSITSSSRPDFRSRRLPNAPDCHTYGWRRLPKGGGLRAPTSGQESPRLWALPWAKSVGAIPSIRGTSAIAAAVSRKISKEHAQVSRTVAQLCVELALTPEQLSERAGLDRGRIDAILLGRWTPSPEDRRKIAAVLGVPIDEIAWGHTTPIQHLYGHGPT